MDFHTFSEHCQINPSHFCSLTPKNLPANTFERDAGTTPGWGRSLGEGNGNPLQYSCLENPKDRGAWWAIIHGIEKESHVIWQLNNSYLKFQFNQRPPNLQNYTLILASAAQARPTEPPCGPFSDPTIPLRTRKFPSLDSPRIYGPVIWPSPPEVGISVRLQRDIWVLEELLIQLLYGSITNLPGAISYIIVLYSYLIACKLLLCLLSWLQTFLRCQGVLPESVLINIPSYLAECVNCSIMSDSLQPHRL